MCSAAGSLQDAMIGWPKMEGNLSDVRKRQRSFEASRLCRCRDALSALSAALAWA